ncbi:hypothetical protein CEK28_04570 [Xenophilus sp. AP218F]|nr:hypothetical protein CEK28_04570 [Xenophilus sp. AP218F]
MRRRIAGGLIAALLAPAVQALEVITLNWRDGDEVAAALRPQLQAGEKLSALDGQLILDASPARSRALRQLIGQLDRKPQALLLEVSQVSLRQDSRASLTLGSPRARQSLDSRDAARAGATLSAGSGRQQREVKQSLRLLDGKSGLIQLTQSRPLPIVLLAPGGAPALGVEYRQTVTGIYVRPRVQGGQVTLQLAARAEDFSGGQAISAEVRGALGEWLTIGAFSVDQNGGERFLLGAANASQEQSGALQLRVSAAP